MSLWHRIAERLTARRRPWPSSYYPWFVGDGIEGGTDRRLFAGAILPHPLGCGPDEPGWLCSHHHQKIREAIACAEAEFAAGIDPAVLGGDAERLGADP